MAENYCTPINSHTQMQGAWGTNKAMILLGLWGCGGIAQMTGVCDRYNLVRKDWAERWGEGSTLDVRDQWDYLGFCLCVDDESSGRLQFKISYLEYGFGHVGFSITTKYSL